MTQFSQTYKDPHLKIRRKSQNTDILYIAVRKQTAQARGQYDSHESHWPLLSYRLFLSYVSLLFVPISISSHTGAVLPRRPVAERRHLSRVLCGFTCPLRYAPSESAAAVAAQLRYGGRPRANVQPTRIIRENAIPLAV